MSIVYEKVVRIPLSTRCKQEILYKAQKLNPVIQ